MMANNHVQRLYKSGKNEYNYIFPKITLENYLYKLQQHIMVTWTKGGKNLPKKVKTAIWW